MNPKVQESKFCPVVSYNKTEAPISNHLISEMGAFIIIYKTRAMS
jgi:hypothetical protein